MNIMRRAVSRLFKGISRHFQLAKGPKIVMKSAKIIIKIGNIWIKALQIKGVLSFFLNVRKKIVFWEKGLIDNDECGFESLVGVAMWGCCWSWSSNILWFGDLCTVYVSLDLSLSYDRILVIRLERSFSKVMLLVKIPVVRELTVVVKVQIYRMLKNHPVKIRSRSRTL